MVNIKFFKILLILFFTGFHYYEAQAQMEAKVIIPWRNIMLVEILKVTKSNWILWIWFC